MAVTKAVHAKSLSVTDVNVSSIYTNVAQNVYEINAVVIINMVIRSGMQRMYLLGRKYYIKRNELIVLYTNASNIHAFNILS